MSEPAADARADAPAGTPPHPPWGVALALGSWFTGLLGSVFAVSVWQAVTGDDLLSYGGIACGLAGTWIGLVGGPVAVSRLRGSGSLVRDFGLRVAGARDVFGGAAAGVLSQLLLVPLIYLPLRLLLEDLDLEQDTQELVEASRGPGLAVLAALLVLGAPIAEELFFRGMLQPALVARFGVKAGVGVTAVAFGAAHFQAAQLPALAAFGLVLGILTVRTGRLGPAIAAHMAFNAVTVAVLVAGP